MAEYSGRKTIKFMKDGTILAKKLTESDTQTSANTSLPFENSTNKHVLVKTLTENGTQSVTFSTARSLTAYGVVEGYVLTTPPQYSYLNGGDSVTVRTTNSNGYAVKWFSGNSSSLINTETDTYTVNDSGGTQINASSSNDSVVGAKTTVTNGTSYFQLASTDYEGMYSPLSFSSSWSVAKDSSSLSVSKTGYGSTYSYSVGSVSSYAAIEYKVGSGNWTVIPSDGKLSSLSDHNVSFRWYKTGKLWHDTVSYSYTKMTKPTVAVYIGTASDHGSTTGTNTHAWFYVTVQAGAQIAYGTSTSYGTTVTADSSGHAWIGPYDSTTTLHFQARPNSSTYNGYINSDDASATCTRVATPTASKSAGGSSVTITPSCGTSGATVYRGSSAISTSTGESFTTEQSNLKYVGKKAGMINSAESSAYSITKSSTTISISKTGKGTVTLTGSASGYTIHSKKGSGSIGTSASQSVTDTTTCYFYAYKTGELYSNATEATANTHSHGATVVIGDNTTVSNYTSSGVGRYGAVAFTSISTGTYTYSTGSDTGYGSSPSSGRTTYYSAATTVNYKVTATTEGYINQTSSKTISKATAPTTISKGGGGASVTFTASGGSGSYRLNTSDSRVISTSTTTLSASSAGTYYIFSAPAGYICSDTKSVVVSASSTTVSISTSGAGTVTFTGSLSGYTIHSKKGSGSIQAQASQSVTDTTTCYFYAYKTGELYSAATTINATAASASTAVYAGSSSEVSTTNFTSSTRGRYAVAKITSSTGTIGYSTTSGSYGNSPDSNGFTGTYESATTVYYKVTATATGHVNNTGSISIEKASKPTALTKSGGGSSVTITPSGGSGSYFYQGTTNTRDISGSTITSKNFSSAGTYYFLCAPTGMICSDTAHVSVTKCDEPTLTVTKSQNGDNVDVTGTWTFQGNVPGATLAYHGTNSIGTAISTSTSVSNSTITLTETVSDKGFHYFSYYTTGDVATLYSTKVSILVSVASCTATAVIGDSSTAGSSFSSTGTGTYGAIRFTNITYGAVTFYYNNAYDPSQAYNPDSNGYTTTCTVQTTYYWKVTGENGYLSKTGSTTVYRVAEPTASKSTNSAGDTVTLTLGCSTSNVTYYNGGSTISSGDTFTSATSLSIVAKRGGYIDSTSRSVSITQASCTAQKRIGDSTTVNTTNFTTDGIGRYGVAYFTNISGGTLKYSTTSGSYSSSLDSNGFTSRYTSETTVYYKITRNSSTDLNKTGSVTIQQASLTASDLTSDYRNGFNSDHTEYYLYLRSDIAEYNITSLVYYRTSNSNTGGTAINSSCFTFRSAGTYYIYRSWKGQINSACQSITLSTTSIPSNRQGGRAYDTANLYVGIHASPTSIDTSGSDIVAKSCTDPKVYTANGYNRASSIIQTPDGVSRNATSVSISTYGGGSYFVNGYVYETDKFQTSFYGDVGICKATFGSANASNSNASVTVNFSGVSTSSMYSDSDMYCAMFYSVGSSVSATSPKASQIVSSDQRPGNELGTSYTFSNGIGSQSNGATIYFNIRASLAGSYATSAKYGFYFPSLYTSATVPCLPENTIVTTISGKKKIADITLNDKLLCYDFNRGVYDYQYPLFIHKSGKDSKVIRIYLEDGTHIDVCGDHHDIYDPNINKFRAYGKNAIHRISQKEKYYVFKDNKKVRIIKFRTIKKSVDQYGIATNGLLTCVANDCLVGFGYMNHLKTEENNQWSKNIREKIVSIDDIETNHGKYSKYLLNGMKINFSYLVSDKLVCEALDPFINVRKPDTMVASFLENNDENNIIYKEDEYIVFPEFKDSKYKVWYNLSDYKYYKPGDCIKLNGNTVIKALEE